MHSFKNFNVVFKSVTIKLGNQKVEQKGTDIGVEVTGKRLDDGVTAKNTKGILSIIEANIYMTN